MSAATLDILESRERELMERGTRSLIVLDAGKSPIFTGGNANTDEGDFSADCGACGAPVARDVDPDDISGYVVKCAACDSYNDLRTPSRYLSD